MPSGRLVVKPGSFCLLKGLSTSVAAHNELKMPRVGSRKDVTYGNRNVCSVQVGAGLIGNVVCLTCHREVPAVSSIQLAVLQGSRA